MTAIKSFRDLIVWQKSMELAKMVYLATDGMPKSEMFGLTSQIRRATVSIPSNIAEGYNRKTRPEYIRGLRIASGSQAELATQLELAASLHRITLSPELLGLLTQIDVMLFALIRKLEAHKPRT